MRNKDTSVNYSVENRNTFTSLKNEADLNLRNRFLKKLHCSHNEELHTMINVLKKGTYIQPHKHMVKTNTGQTIKKGESFLAIEGKGKIILFNEDGTIDKEIPMTESEKTMVWISSNVYHTLVALSDYFIVFENKTGPWKEDEDKFFHPSFPDENSDYLRFLKIWEK